MTFEIIKNAEIPPNKSGWVGRSRIYDFARMEVGDGFDAPRDMGRMESTNKDMRQNSIATSANSYIKRHNPTARFHRSPARRKHRPLCEDSVMTLPQLQHLWDCEAAGWAQHWADMAENARQTGDAHWTTGATLVLAGCAVLAMVGVVL